MVKNPPCNAGEVGSIPGWSRMILHALEQLSLHAATAEALGLRAGQLEKSRNEKPPNCNKEEHPRATTRKSEELPHAATRKSP